MTDIIRLLGTVKEHKLRNIFLKNNIKHFSPDWIIIVDDKLEFIEVKDKCKKFVNMPPYTNTTGHGLDYYQYKNYEDVYNKFNIRTKFFCFDNSDNKIYYNYLDVLIKGKHEVVLSKNNNKKTIIFDINSFEVLKDE